MKGREDGHHYKALNHRNQNSEGTEQAEVLDGFCLRELETDQTYERGDRREQNGGACGRDGAHNRLSADDSRTQLIAVGRLDMHRIPDSNAGQSRRHHAAGLCEGLVQQHGHTQCPDCCLHYGSHRSDHAERVAKDDWHKDHHHDDAPNNEDRSCRLNSVSVAISAGVPPMCIGGWRGVAPTALVHATEKRVAYPPSKAGFLQ